MHHDELVVLGYGRKRNRQSKMKIIIATHNLKKAGEMNTILSKRFPAIEFKTLADFPDSAEPEETGTTYSENARIKAISAFQATGLVSTADDAGLEIDAFGGEPGLYSKRFGGEETTFPEKIAMILDRMKAVQESERSARFRCAVCIAWKGKTGAIDTANFESTCEGRIAFEPSGNGGFGYDPIFYLPELNWTMADLTPEQKHSISHRGKVLKQAGDWLEANLPHLI